ncbi:MAG: hypothetical protein HY701_10225 [Gemmatimonadetes bacterium]|nr:hypothetical protein [Gemmatimonadota bacterium]
MRGIASMIAVFALTSALSASLTYGQEPTPAQIHIGHVMDRFAGTPNSQGLLATALAEARIAVQHATLAAQDPNNLEAMKRHAGHVVHVIDPKAVESGPGLGFGLKRAADGVATHAGLAGKSQGATQNMKTHGPHASTSAANTARRADRILALAKTIQEYAESPAEGAALVAELKALADQLVAGFDANGDGRIGWQEGEGGLQVAEQHIGFMRQAAGSP